jgi:dCMP deaminase
MRQSRDENLIELAEVIAKRGTCSRLQVGALFAMGGRVLVSGYNGAPAGMSHCDHECDCGYPGTGGLIFEGRHLSICSTLKPCRIAQHAEKNAIAFAARYGVALSASTLYVTDSPCYECAMCVINAGVRRVVYPRAYRLTEGLDLLRQANVVVDQLNLDEV